MIHKFHNNVKKKNKTKEFIRQKIFNDTKNIDLIFLGKKKYLTEPTSTVKMRPIGLTQLNLKIKYFAIYLMSFL
jgi:hypothetical protein